MYLRYRILEVGLGTSLRLWLGSGSGPGSGPGSVPSLVPQIPVSQILIILHILQSNGRMNRLILNISNISLNLAMAGYPV